MSVRRVLLIVGLAVALLGIEVVPASAVSSGSSGLVPVVTARAAKDLPPLVSSAPPKTKLTVSGNEFSGAPPVDGNTDKFNTDRE